MRTILCSIAIFAFIVTGSAQAAQQQEEANSNATTSQKRLFTYAGSLLPSDWTVVSILNDRAVIGFQNGSARNALMTELELRDRTFLERLQNGTIISTPLSSTKEKLAQWSTQFTSTVSKFGKTVKEGIDGLLNNNDKKKNDMNSSNGTIIVN